MTGRGCPNLPHEALHLHTNRHGEPIKTMHKKAEDHQDKPKEMWKRHNIMEDRELNAQWLLHCILRTIYEGAKENRPADAPPVSTTRCADFRVTL